MFDDLEDCACEFGPYPDEDEESYQYRRACDACGEVWWSNHCPHDRIQNPCPDCGWRPPGTLTPLGALGFTKALGA